MQPEWFFPERGQSHKPGKSVCARCPVVPECESYRRKSNSEYGLWAGNMTKRKRRVSTEMSAAEPSVNPDEPGPTPTKAAS